MKKCILDIKLVHGPRPRESQRENRAHYSRLHHWTESLVIVHTGTLSEPPKDPTRLVALQSTISTSTCRSPHCNPTDVAQGPKSGWQEELCTPLPSHDASSDLPEPHELTWGSEKVTAPPRWRRGPVAEELRPPAGSPWDGCGEDPNG
jgi:hypothetical protein